MSTRLAARGLLLLSFLCADCATAHSPTVEICAPGLASEPARASRIVRLIDQDGEAAQLFRSQPLRMCFAPGLGAGVLAQDTALFDSSRGDAENAARLGHLLVHRRDGLGDGCAAGLQAALRSERAAAELEQRLRQALGLPQPPPSADADSDYERRCQRAVP